MKNVEACLSDREDRESSLHRCGGAVRLVQSCLSPGKPDKAVLTSEKVL